MEFSLHGKHVLLCNPELCVFLSRKASEENATAPLVCFSGSDLQLIVRVGSVRIGVGRSPAKKDSFVVFAPQSTGAVSLLTIGPLQSEDFNQKKLHELFCARNLDIPSAELGTVSRQSHCKVSTLQGGVLQIQNFSSTSSVRCTLGQGSGVVVAQGETVVMLPQNSDRWYEVKFISIDATLLPLHDDFRSSKGDGQTQATVAPNSHDGADEDRKDANRKWSLHACP